MRGGFLGWLSSGRVLMVFLILTLLTGGSFWFVMQAIDGDLLDVMLSGDDALVRLAELNADQRLIHFRATVTLDVLYPIVYAGLFIGLLSRLAWRWRWVLIWLPIIAALADLSENFVQAMALNGYAQEILHAKDIVTPLKTGALLLAVAICLLLMFGALLRKLSNKKTSEDTQS